MTENKNPVVTPSPTLGMSVLGLVVWLVLSFSAAALGGFFMPGDWYASLKKPSWNPPGWIFGPVWSALYTMMGVAAWMVWKRGCFAAQRWPLTAFLFQLALNALWSPLFFGLREPGWAFAEIILLWLAISWTISEFWRTHRVAAGLLIPYLAWVSFATVLNGTLWRLNG